VTVLGEEAWASRFLLKDRIGYVAERQDLWPRMRGAELLALSSRLFSRWDAALADQLVHRYNLPLERRIGTYSKGMQVQLAQVLALAHRPELLILDEPVAGMDPVVRSQFVEHVLGFVHDTGASVLYSTHLVEEVRALADRIAFLHRGEIILEGPVEDVLDGFTQLLAVLHDDVEDAIAELAPIATQRRDDVAVLTMAEPLSPVRERLETVRLSVLEARRPTLQELFIALLGDSSTESDDGSAVSKSGGRPR
jgi:ABC-2 type transport system ATP-binding protein